MQKKHYSKSYHEAREKFLSATHDADLHYTDTIVDDLTINTAIYKRPNPRNVLVVVSGTHGIEGYSGSAVQLHFLDTHKERLNDDTTLVLIHALNPYGFHHKTRVNHNRVDLNRTFHDAPDAFSTHSGEIDAALDALYPFLVPKRPRRTKTIESLRFYAKILPIVFRAKRTGTYPALKNALVGGQYRYPDAPFYGGMMGGTRGTGEKEVEVFKRIIQEVTEGYDQLHLLDCHTGLGKRYEAVYFSANTFGSEAFERLQRVEPSFTSIVGSEGQSGEIYEAKGSLVQYALQHSKAAHSYAFGIDIGTIPNIPLLSHIIAENQVHHHPDTPKHVADEVKQTFAEAFYPSELRWRDNTIKIYDAFFEKMFKAFHLI
jgi:hypothetical protein